MTPDTDLLDTLDPPPLLRLSGPGELAVAVPYLLGFRPQHSLVLVGLAGARAVVTARLDLDELGPPTTDAALAHVIGALARGGAERLVGLVYDDGPAAPRPPELPWRDLVEALRRVADDGSVELDDAALISRDRSWSYLCSVPVCCPPTGRALAEASAVAAAATFAGLVALPDRETLARRLDPLPDAERERLRPVLEAAERAAADGRAHGGLLRENRSVVRALFAAARAAADAAARPGGPAPPLTDEQVARFGVALRRVEVRDSLWLAMDAGRLPGAELALRLARALPEPYDAAPMFLFGWRAYRAGDGTLAGLAADRVVASDPRYSAADLLLGALARGINPHTLPLLRK